MSCRLYTYTHSKGVALVKFDRILRDSSLVQRESVYLIYKWCSVTMNADLCRTMFAQCI